MVERKSNLVFNIFTSHYLPHVGGIEVFVENFSRELVDLGYSVNIITSDSENQGFLEDGNNCRIFRLKSIHLLAKRFPVPYSLKEFLTIYRECFFRKKTCVIANTRFFLTSLFGLFCGKISGSKLIVIDHGSGHFTYENKFLNSLAHLYEHGVSWIINLFKPDFYGVSESCCNWLKHFKIQSKGVIYNGVSFGRKCDKPKNWKRSWGEKKIIFYAGRLIKEKGILELIKAFDKFSFKKKNYQLIIAGSGDLEHKIKRMFSKRSNVYFIGRLSRNDVFYFLSKTFIFVNPSNYPEGLPTVLLEAGSLSIPVISTPNGGAKEIIFDKKTGMLISRGTVILIYDALKYFDENYDEALEMGKNLNELLKEKFDWKIIVKNFLLDLN